MNREFLVCGLISLLGCGLLGLALHQTSKEAKLSPQSFQLTQDQGDYDLLKDRLQQNRKTSTLVEFADYQCPPCRALSGELSAVLENARGSVGFTFINLPLRSIHPLAYGAAVTAEMARLTGHFDQVHARFYSGPLLAATISNVSRSFQNLPARDTLRRTAEERVGQDMALARRLGVRGTPTVFVVKGHDVFRLTDTRFLAAACHYIFSDSASELTAPKSAFATIRS